MPTEIELLERAVTAWNARDLNGYLELYHADARIHGYMPEPIGKAAAADFYRMIHRTLGMAGNNPPRLEIADVFASEGKLACRFTLAGHHNGPFMDVMPTGRHYVLPGIAILHFRDGQVIERWSETDMLSLLTQIGVVPRMVA